MLKVGILYRHPDADHDNPHIDRDGDAPRVAHVPIEHLQWMTNGTAPPDGFSVYIAKRDPKGEMSAWEGDKLMIGLPTVVIGSRQIEFTYTSFGIRGLDVVIVWHPGWPIAHPLVDSGCAARLWPDPAPVDFAALPVVQPDEFTFIPSGIAACFRSDAEYAAVRLDPLTATPNGTITIC
jgi:hypothetical protein